jgi:predicted N-acyltransferase
MPMFLGLYEDDLLVAAAPAYVKGNSEGEFVFDHGWARFAEGRLRIEYYPKLIVAVPFTPATGPRLLVAEGCERPAIVRAFATGLQAVCEKLGLSSAHVLFPAREEAEALAGAGLVHRHGLQFHWRNAGYRDFDDFIARFPSKRRNQIRRERREVARQNARLEALRGDELSSDLVDVMFEIYKSTVQKYYWGRQYLNRAFFHDVCRRMGDRILVVLARDSTNGRPIAGAFNLLGRSALYGRYWGALEERPFLHFNVCYYFGIEQCIERRLELFEPGAGGEHKLARGFEPAVTHSVHYVRDRRLEEAVRDFAEREREAIAEHVAESQRMLR